MIPYGRQHISDEDIESVVRVLKSDFLTQGEAVPQFEKSVKEYTGSKYSVAVNSGTSALHISCLALGVGRGDWVWTSPITFVASANCALYCGANIDFVDIDSVTCNISVELLRKKLIKSSKTNSLPKVLVTVHFSGLSCDMKEIYSLSKEYGFHVIEDACHALGGKYLDKPIGSCEFSDIAVFSFHPVKSITTGEGGMAVTNNEQLFDKMCLLRSHGITRDLNIMTESSHGPWYYEQIHLGYNYRMTDIQAALGESQLNRLDEFIMRRHSLANRYDEMLEGLPIRCPYRPSDSYSGMHLYVIRLDLKSMNKSHKDVFMQLRSLGISVNLHYIPVHTQPYYRELGFKKGDYPAAETYSQEAISLPMFPGLKEDEQDKVITALKQSVL
ncbi:MAG: UDP-4-amino-4,6-dideoxy-N-acetyl-beta-L-altrosamine transaminase [Gammaproteobacteria bacterium]|nr:UDP-4-amino-4,6-dideoxy-N-acetyl-beta-L-altrosamine transaminase [Gammaproteobacteria bacterium]MDH5801223.1 UDP-4-amino-4,6-dideoxy-N-acetyl-beta-L-altrosamine transaminase [Gammaproteobacteria bacterium]